MKHSQQRNDRTKSDFSLSFLCCMSKFLAEYATKYFDKRLLFQKLLCYNIKKTKEKWNGVITCQKHSEIF